MSQREAPPQESGLSATHEDREARERKPLLVFVEGGVTREAAQQAFIDEVEAWATGHVRVGFSTLENLKAKLIRTPHECEPAASPARLMKARWWNPPRGCFGEVPLG